MGEEGIELIQMRPLVLRVKLPDKRLASPDGADKGIFPADEIEVAALQKSVVIALRAEIGG